MIDKKELIKKIDGYFMGHMGQASFYDGAYNTTKKADLSDGDHLKEKLLDKKYHHEMVAAEFLELKEYILNYDGGEK